MKLGIIARTEQRGLGNLAFEHVEHLHPERVLVVVPNHTTPQRFDRYPDAMVVRWNHRRDSLLDEKTCREWLDGLDVVLSFETFYDWRVCDWAREQGVRTVCCVMPEFYRHHGPNPPPAPDVWWTPTRWRLEHLPAETRVVPVPIAVERFLIPATFLVEHPPRWLHVAGVKAANDRNGTRIVLDALRFLKREHNVQIRSQAEMIPRLPVGPKVDLDLKMRPVDEYWQLYEDDLDLLILPRRYAGLSLPALEAMGAGLGLVMTNVEPQRSEWPIVPVEATVQGHLRTAAGQIPLASVSPKVLAAKMDWLAEHPAEIGEARARAQSFAIANSWTVLEPVIRAELERACG